MYEFISERSVGIHNSGGSRKSVRDGGFSEEMATRAKKRFSKAIRGSTTLFSVSAEGKWKKIPEVAAVARSLSR